ncbi:trace amine-associated receptor 1-like [Denticeps clupeoides]|uniref:trace amine-associated receptor 1-like n=1 Tax=Denticeps clupeoides TaxID=299321 RepID=UPI0010A50007|nr:trace amine-associated receptor 1-like [Denticeps clupeoides]
MDLTSNGSDNIPLCYESLNTSCQKVVYPLFARVPLYIFIGSAAILTICGNLLVIMSVASFRKLQTPTNHLVLSLAVTDLLLGGLVMPPSMIRTVETCWYFGTLFYRYCAICFPLHHHTIITQSVVAVMVFVTWSVSATAGFTIVFSVETSFTESEGYVHVRCDGECVMENSILTGSAFSVVSFYVPGVILFSIYLKIYCIAKQQAHKQNDRIQNDSGHQFASKAERKATKTLAIIMGVFFACWCPFFLSILIDPFTGYSIPLELYQIFGWTGYLNSTLNPMVYALFYSWFRKAFRLILSGKVLASQSGLDSR